MSEFISLFIVLIVGALSFLIIRKNQSYVLNKKDFNTKWQAVQKMCSDKTLWSGAVHEADHLLDEALRKKHIRGKNMGERLVHAQRLFTNNDGVWFGHKLRNRVEAEPGTKLKETDVKEALVGIRQALKDLGALPEPPKPKPLKATPKKAGKK